ncbi:SusC/RagA family TonB-linked outer membrane protein [Jiulongibacter sp. NS-SX5]|uniref:SusC/RagA family TonB-linked outer membrane protein n=1 Tax=Jiulongibacter sp. NS-SX5 TaxID=3463854 RepID=UPI00405A2F33
MKNFLLTFSMVLLGLVGYSQSVQVTGKVTSADDGLSLPGVSIAIQGTTQGTSTDAEGAYALNASKGDVLVFSFVGMQTQSVEVGNQSVINVSMLSDASQLSEVVVTALGVSREAKSLGYAVTNIGGDDVSQAKETNIVNALSGRIAGVQIQGAPSSLGGSSRITIRGSNSFLGNNQPLFVVDGIPISNNSLTSSGQQRGFGGAVAYDYGNAAQDIDPESIANVTVLKGAAATALYGQRGANGVIQITTKNGGKGKGIGVEVSNQMNYDQVRNLIPHQQQYGGGDIASTPSGFYEFTQDGTQYLAPAYGKDGAWGPAYDASKLVRHWDSWDPNASNYKETRPWTAPSVPYDNYFQTGVTRTTNLALTGANDKGNFRLGYTNLDGTGTMPNGFLDRNTFTVKSGYNLSPKLTVEMNGSYIQTNGKGRNITGYNNGNPMQAFTQWWQTQLDVDRLRNSTMVDGSQYTWNSKGLVLDGNNNLLRYDPTPNYFDNPFWARENYLQEDTRKRLLGGANINYNIGGGFSASARIGTDFYNTFDIAGIPDESVETSLYQERNISFGETNMEARITYDKQINDKFSVLAFVGGNRMRQSNRSTTISTNGGLLLDGFYNLSNSSAAPIITTYESNWGINSVFGSASFGYDDWLYVDLTARNDWSSTLPAGANSYFYPAVTASAVLSDLLGLNYNKVSFLKVRASYANAGNDADTYRLADVFSPQTPNFAGLPRYAVPNSQNNPNLKPEFTTEVEFGLEAKFLSNRLGIDVAYFDRSTVDQIFNVPSSSATGYTSRLLNAGEMRNSGLELTLSATPVETKDFSWDLGFNFTKLNNEVVSLADGVESINLGATWAADLRVQQGVKYMALFGQDYVYDDNGNRVVGENGAYLFTSDRVYLGSALADYVGGFNTSFAYKNLRLSGLFDYQFGGIMHSTSLQWSKYSGMHPETVEYQGQTGIRENGMVLEGVKEDGTPNDIAIDPQYYYQVYWNRAAPNVFSTDFVKLRELRLAYTVPNKVLKNAFIRDLTFSVLGRNLALLHSKVPYLDPQVITGTGNRQGLENAQVPPTRSLGFNVSFKL